MPDEAWATSGLTVVGQPSPSFVEWWWILCKWTVDTSMWCGWKLCICTQNVPLLISAWHNLQNLSTLGIWSACPTLVSSWKEETRVALLICEYFWTCRCSYTSIYVFIHPVRSLWNELCSTPSLREEASFWSVVWCQKDGKFLMLSLLLLRVPQSFSMFCYHFLQSFRPVICTSLRWHGWDHVDEVLVWLIRFNDWSNASIINEVWWIQLGWSYIWWRPSYLSSITS